MNSMLPKNQKPTTDTQKPKRKEHKHITKENYQTTREKKKKNKWTENYKNIWKTSNKMAISTYLLIITLNVNELNAPIKRYRVAEWIKKKENKTLQYTVYKSLTSGLKTYTDWMWGDGKRYFMYMETTRKQE